MVCLPDEGSAVGYVVARLADGTAMGGPTAALRRTQHGREDNMMGTVTLQDVGRGGGASAGQEEDVDGPGGHTGTWGDAFV